MQFRHFNSSAWSVVALDSLLERGDPDDWQSLYEMMRKV